MQLKGKIALVTGSSRGAGRGIARVLGRAGATVYVTGRSVRGESRWPETIEETAEQVTELGGLGIPVRCDHAVDSDVEALFARIRSEQGRLDILVNNAWGGYEFAMEQFKLPFWEQPDRWPSMFEAGVRAHLQASRLAVPLMLPQKQGLIVSTSFYDRNKALANLYYDLAKQSINRMLYYMGLDLKPHGIAAVALSPGWMRTERVLEQVPPDALEGTESTEYIGRAVLALATDPNLMAKTGRTLTVGDLAAEYGFADVDGRYIPAFVIPDSHLRD